MAQEVKKDKGCEAGPQKLSYEGLGKRGGVELIGLTRWAACNVSEGLRCEGVNALRVSKIRRQRENVLLLGRGRYVIFLQA